jgi:hypothetical protein
MPITLSGTRIMPTLMPDGRNARSDISPTGSGSATIRSIPAIASIGERSTEPVDERCVAAAVTRRGTSRAFVQQRVRVAADRVRHALQCECANAARATIRDAW